MKKIVFTLVMALSLITLGFMVAPNNAQAQSMGIDPVDYSDFGIYTSQIEGANASLGLNGSMADSEGFGEGPGGLAIGLFGQFDCVHGNGYSWNYHTVALEVNFLKYFTVAIGYQSGGWHKFYMHLGFLAHIFNHDFLYLGLGGQFFLTVGDGGTYYNGVVTMDKTLVNLGIRVNFDVEFVIPSVPISLYIGPDFIFYIMSGYNNEAQFDFEFAINLGIRFYIG